MYCGKLYSLFNDVILIAAADSVEGADHVEWLTLMEQSGDNVTIRIIISCRS